MNKKWRAKSERSEHTRGLHEKDKYASNQIVHAERRQRRKKKFELGSNKSVYV